MSPCGLAEGGGRGGCMASAEARNWMTPPATPAPRLPGWPRAGSTGGGRTDGGGPSGGGGGGGGPVVGPQGTDGGALDGGTFAVLGGATTDAERSTPASAGLGPTSCPPPPQRTVPAWPARG
eukprot:6935697-Alexandrium_andersonii.AAC.1